jgi:serine protease Do
MFSLDQLPSLAAAVLDCHGARLVSVGRNGRGTGFAIADDAVLTNAHNLRDTTTQLTFGDGRTVQGSVRAVDADGDLAVLTASAAGGSTPEPTGVIAVGTPVFALTLVPGGGPRLTFGTVTAVGQQFRGPRGRVIAGSLEHSCPLPRGASGGPVLSLDGSLVAISTHRLGDGLYLARPYDAALRTRIDRLVAGDTVVPRRLGVGIAPADVRRAMRTGVGLDDVAGLLIRTIDPDGVAARSGVRSGDVIVSVDGTDVETPAALDGALQHSVTAGSSSVTLSIVRGATPQTIVVSFEEAAAARQ